MYGDHPTLVDKLDRTPLIEAKAQQLLTCKPPQTFGVHGDWGAGKTSFLRQLRYHLDGNTEGCLDGEPDDLEGGKYKNAVFTVWFDAWQYQHEAAPVIALLHEIRRQFDLWTKTKKGGKKLLEVTARSVLNSFSDIAKLMKLESLPVNTKELQKLGEDYEKRHFETLLGVETIQQYLQEAVKALIKDKKLVVFIDDLDRCSSSAAYRLLEGLKIYLNLNNCIFVLGMNQKIIVDAIAKEMADYGVQRHESEVRIYAEAYLEKLCSSIERLAPPKGCEQLLIDWIVPEHRAGLRLALTDFANDGELIRCLPPNPRRVKALVNLLNQWLALEHIKQLVGDADATFVLSYDALLVLAYVYQFHSELFQRWQYSPDFFQLLKEWAVHPWQKDEWPAYLNCLELPHTIEDDPSSTVSMPMLTSNFPDPYAVNIFWIQPLMHHAQLQPADITPIITAISAYGANSNSNTFANNDEQDQ